MQDRNPDREDDGAVTVTVTMVFDVRELYPRVDRTGRLGFGAGTPGNIVALEACFPDGRWVVDEDGRPTYMVGGMRPMEIMVEIVEEEEKGEVQ